MQKEKEITKVAFILAFLITIILFQSFQVFALSIDNKQDEYISVLPNQKICVTRDITLDTDKPMAYLMSVSNVESVALQKVSVVEKLDADGEVIGISKGGGIIIGKGGSIGNPIGEDIVSEPVVASIREVAQLKPENSESLTANLKLSENIENENIKLVSVPADTETQSYQFCFQMPDYATMKAQKSGEISFCAFQTDSENQVFSDCEHSVWWNFDYGYRQQIIFFSNHTITNLSKIVFLPWNNYMKNDFSDIIFTVQNDSDNFSEHEETFEVVNKSDGMYVNYRLAVDLNCLINVSGICNQTHYVYYQNNIDNSNKSCSNCLNHTVMGYCSGSVFTCNMFGISTTCGNQSGCSWQNAFCSGTYNCSLCSVANCTSCNNCSLVQSTISTKQNETDLWDTQVRQDFATSNYGTVNSLDVKEHTTMARRSYVMFDLSNYTNNTLVTNAKACFYLSTDGSTSNITIYTVRIGGVNLETSMTWNNQPCGTAFNNATACNLTAQSEIVSTGNNQYHCFNVSFITQSIIDKNLSNITFAIKSPELSNLAIDGFDSREIGTNTKPYLQITFRLRNNYTCNGTNNNPCSVFANETACGKCTNCLWNTASCIGTPTPCTFFNVSQSSCENQAICSWNSVIIDTDGGLTYQLLTPVPHPILIDCILNTAPYLTKKIDAICIISQAQNRSFKCNSLIYFVNNTLISASPPNQFIEGVGNINYFSANPEKARTQVANIEFETRDLTEQPLIAKIICMSDTGDKVTYSRYITPQKAEPFQVGDVMVYGVNNIQFYVGYLVIALFVIIVVVVFLAWSGLQEYIKPIVIGIIAVLIIIALITYLRG